MPCSNPSPGYFKQCPFTGENKLVFSGSLRKIFRGGGSLTQGDVLIPCGQCLYCRVKNSRDWAIRCMHEDIPVRQVEYRRKTPDVLINFSVSESFYSQV